MTTGQHTAETLTALASELLENIDRVFIDKIKVGAPKQQADAKTDDLVRLMRAELSEPGFQLAAKEIIEELRNALPREIAHDLAEEIWMTFWKRLSLKSRCLCTLEPRHETEPA